LDSIFKAVAIDVDSSPEEMADKERRDRSRVAAKFRVKFRSLDDLVVTYTHDISQGGLYLATGQFLPAGSVVQLKVELPDGQEPASIIARVAYALDAEEAKKRGRSAGMGMEFLDTQGNEVASRITTYLAQTFGTRESDEEIVVEPANVLVVDDSDSYRTTASTVMRELGHNVQEAKNGLEALGIALKQPPDLILSDVNMPVMDGWQLLRMVRARPTLANVPVIFLTTLSGEAERLKGYQIGVNDYINKPFEKEELAIRAARVLGHSQRHPTTTSSRNALRGDLSQVGLPSVLAFIEVERRSGLLLVVSDDRIATLHIRNGQVVQVDLPDPDSPLEGVERLYDVLDFQSGRFELSSVEITAPDSIGLPTSHVLMEHARRRDEANR